MKIITWYSTKYTEYYTTTPGHYSNYAIKSARKSKGIPQYKNPEHIVQNTKLPWIDLNPLPVTDSDVS